MLPACRKAARSNSIGALAGMELRRGVKFDAEEKEFELDGRVVKKVRHDLQRRCHYTHSDCDRAFEVMTIIRDQLAQSPSVLEKEMNQHTTQQSSPGHFSFSALQLRSTRSKIQAKTNTSTGGILQKTGVVIRTIAMLVASVVAAVLLVSVAASVTIVAGPVIFAVASVGLRSAVTMVELVVAAVEVVVTAIAVGVVVPIACMELCAQQGARG